MNHHDRTTGLAAQLQYELDRGDVPADAAETAIRLALIRAGKEQHDGTDGTGVLATTIVRNLLAAARRQVEVSPPGEPPRRPRGWDGVVSDDELMRLIMEADATYAAKAVKAIVPMRDWLSLLAEVWEARRSRFSLATAIERAREAWSRPLPPGVAREWLHTCWDCKEWWISKVPPDRARCSFCAEMPEESKELDDVRREES